MMKFILRLITVLNIIMFSGIVAMLMTGAAHGFGLWIDPPPCNCSCDNISWGGHTMSVEDAFERAGEGLTIDQWKEVKVIIEGYLNENNSIR
jgi:hypothetical protein